MKENEKIRYILYGLLLFGGLSLGSCNRHEEVDHVEEGFAMLAQARELMAGGQPEAARDTSLSMRKLHPTAIAVRKQALLTLDSCELAMAQAAGDSLKAEFFVRKLQHDQQYQCDK